jgi:hypothetical protein
LLATSLSLVLWLAAAAGPGGEAHAGPRRDDNAARAERGLLPRKVRRPERAPRARRIVVVPPAATWLGEPDPLPEPAALPARAEPADEPSRPATIAAAVSGVEIEVTVVLAWGSGER